MHETPMNNKGDSPKIIWLQPICGGDERLCTFDDAGDEEGVGRMLCEDNVWGHCDECGAEAVKYVKEQE